MRRGLTLIEVIIALLILSFIGYFSVSITAQTMQAKSIMENHDRYYRPARIAMQRITRDIRLAFLTPNTTAINTYRTIFIGKDGGDDDQLWFSSMSHHRRFDKSHEGDQTELTCWLESGPDNAGKVLLRRASGRIDHESDKGGKPLPLLERVTRFNLRYLDNETNEWREDWDTSGAETPNRIPRAVELVIQIEVPDSEDSTRLVEKNFIKTILLELSPPLKKEGLNASGANPNGGLLP